jgi:hypothetical protein
VFSGNIEFHLIHHLIPAFPITGSTPEMRRVGDNVMKPRHGPEGVALRAEE